MDVDSTQLEYEVQRPLGSSTPSKEQRQYQEEWGWDEEVNPGSS